MSVSIRERVYRCSMRFVELWIIGFERKPVYDELVRIIVAPRRTINRYVFLLMFVDMEKRIIEGRSSLFLTISTMQPDLVARDTLYTERLRCR